MGSSALQGLFGVGEGLAEGGDVGFGVVAGERDADGAVDDGGRQAHGLEYVAAVPLRAGGARRDVDPLRLQAVDDLSLIHISEPTRRS